MQNINQYTFVTWNYIEILLVKATLFHASPEDASLHKSPSVKEALKKSNTTGTVCLKDITCAPHGQCEKPRALCEEHFFGKTAPLEFSGNLGFQTAIVVKHSALYTLQNEQQ